MERHDPQLVPLRADDPNLTGSNLMIDPCLSSYKPPPWLWKMQIAECKVQNFILHFSICILLFSFAFSRYPRNLRL